MWLFAAVSVAIATPWFRAWLEALFAELTVVFFTYLPLWIAALSAVLALALARDCKRWADRRRPPTPAHAKTAARPCRRCARATNATKAGGKTPVGLPHARVRWCRGCARPSVLLQVKATTSEIAGSGFHAPQIWTTTLLALAMLPIINSVMVGTGVARDLAASSSASSTGTITTIEQQLSTCRYSDSDQCLTNVTSITALGTYKQAQGYCVAFDAAYVDMEVAGAGLPSQYYPIAVDDAYAEGYANKFSEWSSTNQANFRQDCPALYQDMIEDAGEELLCCTETQYELLSVQIRELPALCPTCHQNLRNMWCQYTCNPSNSLFIDVQQVRLVEGDASHTGEVFPAIEEATYYVGSDVVRDLYDYCEEDTAFQSLLCSPAKNNCSDGQALLSEMGAYKFGSIGSPSQVNFTTIEATINKGHAMNICSCNITAANVTAAFSTDDSSFGEDVGCFSPMNSRLESCAGTCGDLCSVSADENRSYLPACYDPEYFISSSSSASSSESNLSADMSSSSSSESKWSSLVTYLSKNVQDADFTALNYLLVAIGFALACILAAGVFYSTRYHQKKPLTSTVDGPQSLIGGGLTPSVEDTRFFGFAERITTIALKRWGDFVTVGWRSHIVVATGLTLLALSSGGLAVMNIQSEPVKLWTTESSEVYQLSERYSSLFGPSSRTQQLLLVPKDGGIIARTEYLKEAIRLQEVVASLTVASDDGLSNLSFEDICVEEGASSLCKVSSITQFYQNSMDHFSVYADAGLEISHLKNCWNAPGSHDTQTCEKLSSAATIPDSMANCPCTSLSGTVLESLTSYLGGISSSSSVGESVLLRATAIMSVAHVQHQTDTTAAKQVALWEQTFISQMKAEAEKNFLFEINFSSGGSFHSEFASLSSAENIVMPTIVAYVLITIVVAMKVNSFRSNSRYFVASRFAISLVGVLCIALSVSATIGFFAWLGMTFDFITLTALPVIVLGITVNRIFSILEAVELKQQQLQDEQGGLFVGLEDNDYGIEEITCVLVGEALGHCGSNLVATALVQGVIPLLGFIFAVPAIRLLALLTGIAVLLSFVVFMTVFVGAIVLDKRRELSGTYDVLCCMHRKNDKDPRVSDDSTTVYSGSSGGCVGSNSQLSLGTRIVEAYTRWLLRKVTKVVVLVAFTCWTLLSIVSIENLQWGMLVTDVLPEGSYLSSMLTAQASYMGWMGETSVYFVAEVGYGQNAATFNVVDDQDVQAKFCTSRDFCDEFSVPNVLQAVSADTSGENTTYFRQGVAMNSWLDEFWKFSSIESDCCRVNESNSYAFIPITGNDTMAEFVARSEAAYCLESISDAALEEPSSSIGATSFMSIFAMFATTSTTSVCSYGGGSRYSGQFSIDKAPAQEQLDKTTLIYLNKSDYGDAVTAFAYKLEAASPHNSSQSTDKALIAGYAQARALASWVSEKSGVDVWVHSSSYGFLDQFRTVGRDTYLVMGVALTVLFAVYYVALGGFWLALAVSCISGNTAVVIMGLMELFGISLSALTAFHAIVGLVVAIELSTRVVRAFGVYRREATTVQNGNACAGAALRQELANVLFSSAVPEVVAFASLAVTSAGCFQTTGICWRMLMSAVGCGVVNSVVLLPVLLSVVVDAAHGRVRYVKRTNEYGNEYDRESPTASYYHSGLNGANFALSAEDQYRYGY